MKIIAIDPAYAKPHAFCEAVDGRLWKLGFNPPYHVSQCDVVLVEDQFAGRNGGAVIKLARAAGHVVGSIGRGYDNVEWVKPSVWKRGLCKQKAPKTRKLADYVVHQVILEHLKDEELDVYWHALYRTKDQGRRSDLADAVGMYLHYCLSQ